MTALIPFYLQQGEPLKVEQEAKNKVHQRAIGTVRLIGELLNQDVLKAASVREQCIRKLVDKCVEQLSNQSPTSSVTELWVEALCVLLSTCGCKVEKESKVKHTHTHACTHTHTHACTHTHTLIQKSVKKKTSVDILLLCP